MTGSMERAINETQRRRDKQLAFNEENGVVPKVSRNRCATSLKVRDECLQKRAVRVTQRSQMTVQLRSGCHEHDASRFVA